MDNTFIGETRKTKLLKGVMNTMTTNFIMPEPEIDIINLFKNPWFDKKLY